jgi:hypothetical protein
MTGGPKGRAWARNPLHGIDSHVSVSSNRAITVGDKDKALKNGDLYKPQVGAQVTS